MRRRFRCRSSRRRNQLDGPIRRRATRKAPGVAGYQEHRRWFITKALQAGQPARVVQQVVGHKLQGMTEGVYFGGDTLDAKRACVEAVRLPAGL